MDSVNNYHIQVQVFAVKNKRIDLFKWILQTHTNTTHTHRQKPVTKIPSAFVTVGAPSQVQSMPLPACTVRNFIYDYAVVKMCSICTCSYAYLCVYVCVVSLCVHVYVICIVCVYVGTYPGFQKGVSNFVQESKYEPGDGGEGGGGGGLANTETSMYYKMNNNSEALCC